MEHQYLPQIIIEVIADRNSNPEFEIMFDCDYGQCNSGVNFNHIMSLIDKIIPKNESEINSTISTKTTQPSISTTLNPTIITSDLTISKSKHITSDIVDLKGGKIPFSRIGVCVNTADEEYFLQEISDGSRIYYPLKSLQYMIDGLLNGNIDATFLDNGSAEYITNHIDCNLTLIGESFTPVVFAIVE
ncbi:hypothetical protein I4U23_015253 [Adineta vaga]|nr:hypothetical protein I4U23_015253 [Adineta vaga]